MELNPDFKDMLSALNDADVDYMVVGAYAVAAYGFPRATGDLDIWIRADSKTAPKVFRAITVFGAPLSDLTLEDFASPSIVFQIGVPPGRIDLLTSISGVSFDDAWPRHIRIELDGISLPLISRSDLIANKKASGRLKDLVDVQSLENNPQD